MRSKTNLFFSAGAVLILGAFVSLLLQIRISNWFHSILIGYFYALSLVTALLLTNHFVLGKIRILSSVQQWLIRSLVYVIAISFSYLTGLIFQTLILVPFERIREAILSRFWTGFVQLVSIPFDAALQQILPDMQQPLVLTFFTILFFIGMISLVISYVEMKWRTNQQELLRERAELLALKSQIEPHFLFNSLNTIASLIGRDAQKSEQLLLQLSEIMQYMSLNARKTCIGIQEEISFSKKYCTLLVARFEGLLEIQWDEKITRNDVQVPVLIIQPLIENSVRHGWTDREKTRFQIDIDIHDDGDQIRIGVSDNGRGIPARILQKLPVPDHALANIAERLELIYKKNGLLKVHSIQNEGTSTYITIPENCHA
jgi:sensor histidine kinase YesM